jgi:hypothetical protein
MDKLRRYMVYVKRQTQYIVLFHQMICTAVKLLTFPCFTGKRPMQAPFLPGFPQGYVGTRGYSAENAGNQEVPVLAGVKWLPNES